MSYEMCLAIRQYENETEQEAVHKKAFLKMQEYVDKDGNYFDESEWRKNCFDFDEELEIYASDSTMSMIRNNPSFVPEKVIDDFRAKTGKDFLVKKGEYDLDGLRVVSVSKEDVLCFIRDYHQAIADSYKKMADLAKNPNWLNLDELQTRLKDCAKNWEGAASRGIKLDKDGKLKVPYPLSWSYEYTIIRLIGIVNKYDWDCVDAVLYGR